MRDANRSVALFAGTIQSATFNLETLRRRASENFITVTELADTLVRRENLPFRISHKIVGTCVKAALHEGGEITHEILQNAAREVLGREIEMTEAQLKETLSPENFVRIRTIYGGTAPEETRRALMVERDNETIDEEWIIEKIEFLENASSKLKNIADKKLENRNADKFSIV
jgi:argininosuccinate lyase